jgi:multiple sugar transport system permease protein
MKKTEARGPNRGRLGHNIALYSALIILALFFVIPYYVMIRNALATRTEITGGSWTWFPADPSFAEMFKLMGSDSGVMRGMLNSFIIATLQVIGQLAIAAAAGYGLARIKFRHRNAVFIAFLSTMMVPSAVTFVPTFAVVAQFQWINTLQGIVVPGLFNVFSVFIFRQFFLDFPVELEEAGKLDGLGTWGVFFKIVLPNSKGVMTALGAIAFINSWNAFLWPLIIGQNENAWTVQVTLSTFLNSYKVNLPALFSGSVLSVLPLVILFFVFQRYIVQGVKLSGVKG